MHLFAFFILFLVIQSTITAQLTGYQFSQSGGTYSPIAGGTVWQTSAATINTDAVSSSIALPFTFTFNGSACDKVYISNNGFITLANTTTNVAPTSTTYNPISAATGYIAAISGYGFNLVGSTYTGAAPEIRYQTNGSAPNRTFVVQFKDVARSGFTGASADKMNFQIILNETISVRLD